MFNRILFLIFLIFSNNLIHNLHAGKYADVFTREIYGQEELIRQQNLNEDTINRNLETELMTRKQVQVHQRLARKLQIKIDALNIKNRKKLQKCNSCN